MRRVLLAAAASLAASLSLQPAQAAPAGFIRSFHIIASGPAFGGATPPGAPGPYEVIAGVVLGALDPHNPQNAAIQDLDKAPRAPDGMVDYMTNVVILRPVNPASASRVLFYDVANRGRKLAIGAFIGADPTGPTPPPAGFPSLLRQGVTVVWSGWQPGFPLSLNSATVAKDLLGVRYPVATDLGKPITAMSREEFIPDYNEGPANRIPLSYPPADPADRASVTFTARQSWFEHYGSAHPGRLVYTAPSVPVTAWHYEGDQVVFTPPASVPGPDGTSVPADAGTIYSFVYRAKDPTVNGIAFAAIRDLVSYLRHDGKDAEGNPNPLDDLAAGHCVLAACPARPEGNFDIAIGEGISQSGRLLRDFLWRGFNRDSEGRAVFEGLMPIIAGGRRTWVAEEFSQPGRWSKEHEDHWQVGDQFPFAYNTLTDPLSGRTDGLLAACTATHTCPKIMQVDGEFEWWGARASLVVTDLHGHDLKLPDNVRYYLVPGTKHGGGPGVSTGLVSVPAAGSLCQLPDSPVAEAPVERALIPALIAWVTHDKAPPPSQYPTVAAGELTAPDRNGFPDLSAITVQSAKGPVPLAVHFTGQINQLAVTDYVNAIPTVRDGRFYDLLVPKTGRDGNALGGVRVPELAAPLATYAGWSLRGQGHAIGEGCIYNGAAIPLAVDPAQRAPHDTRPSLAELYTGRADYQAKVAAAAEALVKAGYLLEDDAKNLYEAHAQKVSPELIAKP